VDSSDPRSKSYGQYYKPEEIAELFAPDNESFEIVKSWLISAGISGKSIAIPRSKGWVHFDATVAQLESALKTKYYRYEYIPSGKKYFGTNIYHLPPDVSDVVDFIIPAVAMAHHVASFGQSTKKRRSSLQRALPRSMDGT
jgi:tripeptidyl-peptidase-1